MTNQTRLPNGLTQKQFTFYNNLIEQMKETGKMNVKQAALSAGFSPRNYSSIASRLLKKREGQAYIKSLQRESTHSAISNLDWVMEKLMRIDKQALPRMEPLPQSKSKTPYALSLKLKKFRTISPSRKILI